MKDLVIAHVGRRRIARKEILVAAMLLGVVLGATGQVARQAFGATSPNKTAKSAPSRLTPQQKFVLDTVNLAVALPQSDPQDRLRVLATAADVVSPVDRKLARNLWREGVGIESELIRLGQSPAVSVMAMGQADCASAEGFVENVPESSVVAAEQSLIGAITSCQKQTMETVARKLDAALQKRIVAPRALMATMEAEGTKSRWSQTHFEEMFSSLPDAKQSSGEAQNFAAMYAHMSGDVEKDSAKKAGLELLDWRSPQDDSGLRTLAIRIAAGAMKQAIGEQGFEGALSSDVIAGSAVRNAENAAEVKIDRPPAESASVLEAIDNHTDQTDYLRQLPASQRAREAAANGFAAGTSGNKQQAGKYFDMAFAAVDEVWEARTPEQNSAAVVEEVSEAAAQVDSLNALNRAEGLRDPSAQAIAMLAVARVVAGAGLTR